MYAERSQLLKVPTALDTGGVKEGDIFMEVGSIAFDGIYTDTTNRPVVTKLTKIIAGFAVAFDSYSPATDANTSKIYEVFVRPDVTEDTNSHDKQISIYRSSQGALSGLKVAYTLFGRVFATD